MDSSPNASITRHLKRGRKNPNPSRFVTLANSNVSRNGDQAKETTNDSSLENNIPNIESESQRKNSNPSRNLNPASFNASGNSQPKETANDSSLEKSKSKRFSKRQIKKSSNLSRNVTTNCFNASENSKHKGTANDSSLEKSKPKKDLKRKRKNLINLSWNVTPTSCSASGNSKPNETADESSLKNRKPKRVSRKKRKNPHLLWNVTPTGNGFGNSESKETADDSSLKNTKPKRGLKSQKKNLNPSRTSVSALGNGKPKGKNTTKRCKNLACKAILRREEIFCKTCTCCICYKYDAYNKDPTMWLTCKSDPPLDGESCGFSFHLNCAFKEGDIINVDGCFSCVSCGKRNGLLECLKKTLTVAKETRSVKVLCSRLVLAQKLLKGVEKYREVSETVEKAVESLEADINGGPLSDLPTLMCRGIVNRLKSISEVKNLCSVALTLLESQGSAKELIVDEVEVSTKISQEGNEQTLLANNIKDLSATEGKRFNLETNGPEKLEKGGLDLVECIKILRQLERLGHVKRDFREKFLTWFSLKATAEEKYIVKTYIDSFNDDLKDLAKQLVDTFSDRVSRKRSAIGRGDGGI